MWTIVKNGVKVNSYTNKAIGQTTLRKMFEHAKNRGFACEWFGQSFRLSGRGRNENYSLRFIN